MLPKIIAADQQHGRIEFPDQIDDELPVVERNEQSAGAFDHQRPVLDGLELPDDPVQVDDNAFLTRGNMRRSGKASL